MGGSGAVVGIAVNRLAQLILRLLDGLRIGGRQRAAVGLAVRRDLAVMDVIWPYSC